MQLASVNARSESEWLAIRRRKLPTTPFWLVTNSCGKKSGAALGNTFGAEIGA